MSRYPCSAWSCWSCNQSNCCLNRSAYFLGCSGVRICISLTVVHSQHRAKGCTLNARKANAPNRQIRTFICLPLQKREVRERIPDPSYPRKSRGVLQGYLDYKKTPPHYDHYRALSIGLL